MKKSNTLSLLLALACAFSSLAANAPAGKDKPEYAADLIPDSISAEAYDVIRALEIEVELKDLSRYSYRERGVITILSEKSRSNHLSIWYNSSRKIKDFSADVYDGKGRFVRKLKNIEIQDMSAISNFSIYEDSRWQHCSIESSDHPYTIEYTYEWEEKDFFKFPNGIFQPTNNTAIENGSYRIVAPNDLDIIYKYSEEVSFSQANKDGSNIYTFSCAQQPAHNNKVNEERFEEEPYPVVLAQPLEFEVAGYKGSNADWEDWGNFFYALNEGRATISDDLKNIISNLKKESENRRELIQKLYAHLQDNTRYVSVQLGIGGFQTFPASYVEQNQYGDCKALSNFMKGMLEEAGVESRLTITHLGDGIQTFHDDFPSASYFNHMVLYIPEEEMFLECTSSDYPPGYMGRSNQGKNAVLLTEAGGEVVTIPVPSPEENLSEFHTEIDLDVTGDARIAHREKAYQRAHEYYRMLSKEPTEDVKKWIQQSSHLPAFEFEKLEVKASPDKAEAEINFEISVSKLAARAGSRIFVPVNPVSPFHSPYESKKEKFKVFYPGGYKEKNRIVFQLPEGYVIESIPKFEKVEDERYGYLKYNTLEEDGKLVIEREFLRLPIEVAPSEYKELRRYFKEVEKTDNQQFVLVVGRP